MNKKKIAVAGVVVLLVAAYFAFDLGQFLSLESVKARQADIAAYRQSHPLQAALGFFAVYVAVTGLSLPGAALMTLVAGAVFGLLVYFAFMWPNRPVMIFPIMVPIKAKTLALIFVGISVLYGLFPAQGDMTAHLGHLGGAVFGFLYFRYERRVKTAVAGVRTVKRRKEDQKSMDREREIDRLLSKIHEHGINALTDAERKFLNKASQGYRKQ